MGDQFATSGNVDQSPGCIAVPTAAVPPSPTGFRAPPLPPRADFVWGEVLLKTRGHSESRPVPGKRRDTLKAKAAPSVCEPGGACDRPPGVDPRPTSHGTAQLDALKDRPTGCVQWAALWIPVTPSKNG